MLMLMVVIKPSIVDDWFWLIAGQGHLMARKRDVVSKHLPPSIQRGGKKLVSHASRASVKGSST
jgi:hypothetical protein